MILHLLHRLAVALGLARRRVAIDPRIRFLGALGQPEREFEDYDRLPFLMAKLHYGEDRMRLPGRLDCIEVALVEAWEKRAQCDWVCSS